MMSCIGMCIESAVLCDKQVVCPLGGWKYRSGDEEIELVGHCRDIEIMNLFRPRKGRH